jgi:hypothetical protein
VSGQACTERSRDKRERLARLAEAWGLPERCGGGPGAGGGSPAIGGTCSLRPSWHEGKPPAPAPFTRTRRRARHAQGRASAAAVGQPLHAQARQQDATPCGRSRMFIVEQVDSPPLRCLRKTKRCCLGLVFLQEYVPLPHPQRRWSGPCWGREPKNRTRRIRTECLQTGSPGGAPYPLLPASGSAPVRLGCAPHRCVPLPRSTGHRWE